MNRWGIVVLYDPDSIVSESDLFLLKEVSTVVNRLIVVINTDTDIDVTAVRRYTKEIIIRPNKGVDGGAVRCVICDYLNNLRKEVPEELLICNNSFFGPFIPLIHIFDEMDSEKCDYWGLSGRRGTNTLYIGVDSYFWVFRKKILEEGKLISYLEKYVSDSTNDFSEICGCYESGINALLLQHYRMSVYLKQEDINIFDAGDLLLINYGFPILKRKFFVERRTDIHRIRNVFRFLRSKDVDVRIISEKINRFYGINPGIDDLPYELVDIDEMKYKINKFEITYSEIDDFIKTNHDIYIYGTGFIASLIWGVFGREKSNICGFVKSIKDKQKEFHGYPVKSIEELTGKESIIVAMNEEHARQVQAYLIGYNTLYVR